jgi:hypothetical protein
MNSKFSNFIRSEWVLGILVALLSVLIAAAAYQSSLFDSKESDFNVEGQKQLTESNSMYLEANQFVIYDYQLYDGWYVNDGVNDELAQYYMDSFSEELTASLSRPDGLFDDEYYTEMYADAEATYDESMTAFEDANGAGDKADQLQLVVLIFAVGLALAAYASMLDKEAKLRFFFGLLSILALVFGAIQYISTLVV